MPASGMAICPLLENVRHEGPMRPNRANLIMVTSAMPGEGKSFTSLNLAMSIAAELDNTVMLVDADVARPSVLRMLGLPNGPGLLDLLEGKSDISIHGAVLAPGALVCLVSTCQPGATNGLCRPLLERGGLRVGQDGLTGA